MAFDDDDDDDAPRRRQVAPQQRFQKGTTWFRFDLRNIEIVEDALLQLAQQLKDLSPFFRNHFVPAYLQDMQLQFESEGQFTGGWDGLTPEYERWKKKHYPNALINQRTRRLKRSFSPGGRSKYLNIEIRPRSAKIENLLPYALWVDMVRPLMIPPNKLNRKRYTKLVEAYLGEILKKLGLSKGSVAKPDKPKSFLGFD